MSVDPVSLEPDSLLAEARARTGLEDFGDPSFEGPFRRLVLSMDVEGQLHEVGRAAAMPKAPFPPGFSRGSASVIAPSTWSSRWRTPQPQKQRSEVSKHGPVWQEGMPTNARSSN